MWRGVEYTHTRTHTHTHTHTHKHAHANNHAHAHKHTHTHTQEYTYECPSGDEFRIAHSQIMAGERIALCPSCTLRIRVKAKDDVITAMHEAITE